jgi:hypothetical protein
MAKNEAKIKFTAETGEFNDAIKSSNEQMAELRAEMKLNETQMKATGTTVEGLNNKHKILQNQLKASEQKTQALSQKVNKAVELFGENSTEASKLRTQLLNAQTAEEKLKKSVSDCEKELKAQEEAAKNAGEGFTVMKGAVADLASEAIQGAIGKLAEFSSYLSSLPQETLEFRQDISTLNTSFDDMGLTSKQAGQTVKDMFKIFGEDDRAVETSNLIAKMSDDQKDLSDWTTITTGVYGRFQDSLPVESLAEASMEVAKTGQLTGGLVDALVWAGESEEDFQAKLDACSSEQERQSLITDTLMGLYGESAETYRETAEGQMALKEATYENMQAEAELAAVVEPVTTEFTNLKTELLVGAKPAIQAVSGVLLNAMEWMKEHPTTVKAVAAAVGVLAVGITGLGVAMAVYTAYQWAMNSAVLANPITWVAVGIVAAIAGLVAAGVVLYENWDTIKVKAGEVWNGVVDKFNGAKTKVKGIIDTIKGFFNFSFNMPHIPTPHFAITPAGWKVGDLLKGIKPTLGIEWYAQGGVLTNPTIFGMNGNNAMIGGESGAEAVLPISVLQDFINRAFDRNVLSYVAAGGGGDVYNFYVNDATINDNAQMREVAKSFISELVRLGGMNK